jgi:hypothetical protein
MSKSLMTGKPYSRIHLGLSVDFERALVEVSSGFFRKCVGQCEKACGRSGWGEDSMPDGREFDGEFETGNLDVHGAVGETADAGECLLSGRLWIG